MLLVALLLALSLAVIIRQGFSDSVGMFFGHVIGKRSPVLVLEHVFVGQAPKVNPADVLGPVFDFNASITMPNTGGKDVLSSDRLLHVERAPLLSTIAVEKFGHWSVNRKCSQRTQPPLYL